MELHTRTNGDVAVVTVTGEITMKRGGDTMLSGEVRTLIQQGLRHVLVDLGGVSFIDSAGLGELLEVRSMTKNHGGSLKLFNLTKALLNMLAITKLTTVLDTYPDEAQALATLGAQRPGA